MNFDEYKKSSTICSTSKRMTEDYVRDVQTQVESYIESLVTIINPASKFLQVHHISWSQQAGGVKSHRSLRFMFYDAITEYYRTFVKSGQNLHNTSYPDSADHLYPIIGNPLTNLHHQPVSLSSTSRMSQLVRELWRVIKLNIPQLSYNNNCEII